MVPFKFMVYLKKEDKYKAIDKINKNEKFETISGTGSNGAIIHYKVNKKSNILITNDDDKTLKIIHESLLSHVNKISESNLAIYDSKRLENFVADTLLGSYDNALSKLNQNKEKN